MPKLLYEGLVAQLTAFDHAVGSESYRLPSHRFILCTPDVGRMSAPLAPPRAQIRRKLELLVAHRICDFAVPLSRRVDIAAGGSSI